MQQKVADAGVLVGWFGWFLAHITEINDILQFLLLLSSLVATIIAIRYHLKRMPK